MAKIYFTYEYVSENTQDILSKITKMFLPICKTKEINLFCSCEEQTPS